MFTMLAFAGIGIGLAMMGWLARRALTQRCPDCHHLELAHTEDTSTLESGRLRCRARTDGRPCHCNWRLV